MSGKAILERFVQKNPLAVMTRCVCSAMIGEQMNELFERASDRQYEETQKFATLAMSVAEIVLGTLDNRNQAHRKYAEELQASTTAYYRKLNRMEPAVSEAVVRHSVERGAPLLAALGFQPWDVLEGYRCFSLDGNHLQKTQKRLKETRGLCAAALPGTVVARYDHQTGLFDQSYLLEDAHAQESTVLDRVIDDLQEKDLLIADRHFCIVKFLWDAADRGACFVIRQHGRLKGELQGKRCKIGRIDTGVIYEQRLCITDKQSGRVMTVRRITVQLDEPTRDGDTEIHLLSNVPTDHADARTLANLYRDRWEIENAFHVLTMTLHCESSSNCFPRCALFQFCMAMFAYNARQVLFAALYAEHAQEDVDQMSQYQVAVDIVKPMAGLETAITDDEWHKLTPRTPRGMATFLCRVSQHVDIKSYRKSVRGPKKPKPKRKRCKAGTHVATHRLLQQRKQTR